MQQIETEYESFLQSIQTTLKKNGFPTKRVALPLEKMYAIAHAKHLNFNKALLLLDENGIAHEKTNSKIIFFIKERVASSSADVDWQAMLRQANELIKTWTPEQIKEAESLYQNMTAEQKAELQAKAKQMGIPSI